MPSAEAKLKKNRCGSCFDCPVCGHTLVTRSTSHTYPNPDDPTKTIAKKMYYMACGFCRWTTRDVGLPDQNVATGSWPSLQNPHEQRISSLLENYKIMAQIEKAEHERKKYVSRRSHLYRQDKFGGSVAGLRRKGMSTFSSMSSTESKVPGDLEPSPTVDTFEPLSNEFFTEPAPLAKTTKLAHRHSVPEFQPIEISKLHPIHKHLLMRKSLRCRVCEHNLSKADFNPSSIKFKIQLTAQHHVPEVRIMNPATFSMNKESIVTLTLSNPSVFGMTVSLHPIEDESDTDYCSAKVELPKKELLLGGRDEPSMQMYDDSSQADEFKDDPKVIVFRKGNKIGFVVKVTPVVKEGDVKIQFMMKHEFRNTTAAALQSESKEPEIVWLEHKVYMNLGPM